MCINVQQYRDDIVIPVLLYVLCSLGAFIRKEQLVSKSEDRLQ